MSTFHLWFREELPSGLVDFDGAPAFARWTDRDGVERAIDRLTTAERTRLQGSHSWQSGEVYRLAQDWPEMGYAKGALAVYDRQEVVELEADPPPPASA